MNDALPGPDAAKPPTAAGAVTSRIERLILEGSLRPGEPLLPERELPVRLGVSRPTVRLALKDLESRGLLTSREGRGARVAQLAPATITDPLIRLLSERGEVADDYLEFRDTVETAASAMAAMRANDVDLDRIRACAERIERAHVTADPQEEAEADADLHAAIYEASHNLVLLQIMHALSAVLQSDVLNNRARLFAIPQIRDLLRDQHMAIAGAILERRPEDAREAAHAHLSYLRRTMRELSDAEARLDLSRRRRDGGGLTPPRA